MACSKSRSWVGLTMYVLHPRLWHWSIICWSSVSVNIITGIFFNCASCLIFSRTFIPSTFGRLRFSNKIYSLEFCSCFDLSFALKRKSSTFRPSVKLRISLRISARSRFFLISSKLTFAFLLTL